MSDSNQPHVIRLRGPWEYEPLGCVKRDIDGSLREFDVELPPPGRVQMPSDWSGSLGSEFRGRVGFDRRFGRPTGLTDQSQVMLVIESVRETGHVTLNGSQLGTLRFGESHFCCDVTELLGTRNKLTIEVEALGDVAGGVTGEVRLEIYERGS